MTIRGSIGGIFAPTPDQVFACDLVGSDPAANGIYDFTDASTTADITGTRFTIADPSMRYWSKGYDVTVKVAGAVVSSGYTIEHAGGVVVFGDPPAGAVTVSGKYLQMHQVGGCFNWALEQVSDTRDATRYVSGGWREKNQSMNSFVATAKAYWVDADWLRDLGQEIILVLYTDTGNDVRYEGFAIVNEDSISNEIGKIIEETIGFYGQGPIFYRED